MLVAFVVALVFGIAALYWIILKKASEKILVQYQILAERLGLELNCPPPSLGGFIRSEPSLFGELNGREISISVPGKGLQNSRQIETVLKLELKGRGFGAQIAPAGLLGGLRQRDSGGKPRWLSGNAEFDAAVDIRADAANPLDYLLGADRRRWLMAHLKSGKGTIYLGKSSLAYAELGLIANEARRERFEEVLKFLLDLAETIESSRGQ